MKTMTTTRYVLLAILLLFAGCSDRAEKTTAAPAEGATCAAHGDPKELCFICDPSLREKGRLWCDEHGRYEDRCFECHPELRDPNRLFCDEHSLYEDECFLCHPELLKTRTETSGAAVLMCEEHGVPEEECGICHPELLAGKAPGEGLRVRLPSMESAANAGITVTDAGEGGMLEGVECLAELSFNQNKLAEITPLAAGVVRSVEVDLGSRVVAGTLLARIASAAMGEAQSAYLRAFAAAELDAKTLERERRLHAQRISSDREVQQAEAAHKNSAAALRDAERHLILLGLTEEQIKALDAETSTAGDLEIRAPFAGEIVERAAVKGGRAESGAPLFLLADTSTLWAIVSIPEPELQRVHVGQQVRLTVESLPGETFVGTLTWLSPQVDSRTRMTHGRVEVDNKHARLKAQMFARALIVTDDSERAVIVPRAALQNVGGTSVVFVKSAEDLFDARPVRVGASRNGWVEIVAGLRPHEPIVVAGSFALKSQLLISRLGAGCVD